MSRLREAARHVVLSAGGHLPFVRRDSDVRFLYGHALAAANVPRFRRTLRMLRDRFEFVSMRQAVELARAPDAPSGRYLAFSFDDGFRDTYDHIAPVLDEVGARACFFLPTAFIGCDEAYRVAFLRRGFRTKQDKHPLTWAMVTELHAAGFEIGAHTVDHVNLAELPLPDAVSQVLDSRREIERRLDAPCGFFAWPFGTAAYFPPALLPLLTPHFTAIFSAIRTQDTFSMEGGVVNRDHFEPDWPTSHVRYFVRRPARTARSAPPVRGAGAEERVPAAR